ncbi:hypothetical protein [Burkholderia ubonensis]|uniref:hypothetical protein n=1 Tax=Burkholderia ubonensis TaxID=101571 RepID=UPI000AC72E84|nr:hypothetical protein [Burkholderia ubonensis]
MSASQCSTSSDDGAALYDRPQHEPLELAPVRALRGSLTGVTIQVRASGREIVLRGDVGRGRGRLTRLNVFRGSASLSHARSAVNSVWL